eukprot:NODE_568_length_2061_cov_76.663909_g528_i0.p1 GENE.NODE_568_length_2061_cov_76.663909_g528_i0~~NODE_568_length_2061_cov_76.663909_g528_i0.p1  ORF type:complete len:635 (-),score=216.92 NODE_568_length_2061_cov_76.663909_g528_i0:157-2019(-)
MSEVDSIVLFGLRSIGCEVEAPISDFDAPQFYKCCVACLKHMGTDTDTEDLPNQLPMATATKFKACTALAKAIQSAGYPDEIGFNSFMYLNHREVTKLLAWLVNQLPTEGGAEEPLPVWTLLKRAAGSIEEVYQLSIDRKTKQLQRIPKTLSGPHELPPLRHLHTQHLPLFLQHHTPEAEASATPVLHNQIPDPRDLPASLLEYNTRHLAQDQAREEDWTSLGIHSGLPPAQYHAHKKTQLEARLQAAMLQASGRYACAASGSFHAHVAAPVSVAEAPVHTSRFMKEVQFAHSESTEAPPVNLEVVPAAEAQAAVEAALQERLASVRAALRVEEERLMGLRRETERLQAEAMGLREKATEVQREGQTLEQQYETHQKTIAYADDVDGNRSKLQQLAAGIQAELAEIQAAFEAKHSKYTIQLSFITAAHEERKATMQAKLDELHSAKHRIKALAVEMKAKEEQKAALQQELNRLPKTIDRDHLIQRIMDIIRNIKKQQNEITKINLDNKELQKEINSTTEAVTRSFVATEEKVYKDAQKDDVAKKVYKQLIALHENFTALIDVVDETGRCKQAQHALEEKKSAMAQRNDGLNMQQLEKDLFEIKQENQELAARLKERRKGH